jgi:indole-3-glycerol phosphate synthase
MSILQEILKYKKEELKQRKSIISLKEIKTRLKDIPPTKDFKTAIKREKNQTIKLIAEIKRASPSEGVIRVDFDLSEIASVYDSKDVSAISVLTEERFFQGSLDYLNNVRRTTKKSLLRKDFIIDDYQVYESRLNGADAILLIVAALDRSQLAELQGLSNELSLECLIEVHNLKELDIALYSGVEIIGINNRDLNTSQIDLNTTFELLKDIPDNKVIVSESGINTRGDVKAIESTRADAILVGTTLMKAKDIGAKIDELLHNSNSTDEKT